MAMANLNRISESFKLQVEVKKLTVRDVLVNFDHYRANLGDTGAFKTEEWKLGYVCALRDAGLLSQSVWGDLTDKIRLGNLKPE